MRQTDFSPRNTLILTKFFALYQCNQRAAQKNAAASFISLAFMSVAAAFLLQPVMNMDVYGMAHIVFPKFIFPSQFCVELPHSPEAELYLQS
jgi:hypothetical protein